MGHSVSRHYLQGPELAPLHVEAVHRLSLRLGPAVLACRNAPKGDRGANLRRQIIVTQLYDLLLNDTLLSDVDRSVLWRASSPLRRGRVYPIHWVYQAPAAWSSDGKGLYRLHKTQQGTACVREVRRSSEYTRLRDECLSLCRARRIFWPTHTTVTRLVRECIRAIGSENVPEHRPMLLAACWITETGGTPKGPGSPVPSPGHKRCGSGPSDASPYQGEAAYGTPYCT